MLLVLQQAKRDKTKPFDPADYLVDSAFLKMLNLPNPVVYEGRKDAVVYEAADVKMEDMEEEIRAPSNPCSPIGNASWASSSTRSSSPVDDTASEGGLRTPQAVSPSLRQSSLERTDDSDGNKDEDEYTDAMSKSSDGLSSRRSVVSTDDEASDDGQRTPKQTEVDFGSYSQSSVSSTSSDDFQDIPYFSGAPDVDGSLEDSLVPRRAGDDSPEHVYS